MKRRAIWIGLAVAGAAGLAALRYLDQNPLLLPITPDEREVGAVAPQPTSRGDLAVWVCVEGAPDGTSYADVDFSCAWLSLLEAEIGAYSVITGERPALDGIRSLIVSASALDAIEPGVLRAFAEGGGVVLLDAPRRAAPFSGRAAELVGGSGRGGAPFPTRDLLPRGRVTDDDRRAFDAAPFARPDAVLDLSGLAGTTVSGLFRAADIGRGRVIAAACNIARLYTTMLQGAPHDEQFGLTQRFGDYDDILEPDDLVADARLRENEVPFADLLARAVCGLLDPPRQLAIPRLLWFPAGSNGVILMTHDEDLRGGEKSLWLSEWDRDLGLRGTTFAISHPRLAEDWQLDRDMAAAIGEAGGTVGLHWNQYPMPRGVGPIEPIMYRMSCRQQMDWLRALSPATHGTRVNRNHYLILRDGWTEIFRVMAAEGVRLDSTFGANKGRGYLFGTARPYPILDTDGLPLPIRELPFVNQEDWGGADQAYFSRLLEANAVRHKGLIVSLFHPHLVVLEDEGRALFEHVAKAALATGHRPFHFEELLDFWDARDRATIHTKVDGGRVEITATVDRDDLALAFPVVPNATLTSARTASGTDLPLENVTIGGSAYKTLRLPSGTHRIIGSLDG